MGFWHITGQYFDGGPPLRSLLAMGQGKFLYTGSFWIIKAAIAAANRSNADDRIALLEKIVNLIGLERLGILIADREFIGHRWAVRRCD